MNATTTDSARRRFDLAARDLAECCAEHEPAYEPDADTALDFVDKGVIEAYAAIEPDLIGETIARVDKERFWLDFPYPYLLGGRVREAVYLYVAECLASAARDLGVEVVS